MNMRILLLLMSALLVCSVGCRTTSNVLIPGGSATMATMQDGFTLQDMREAIWGGCHDRGWIATDRDANTIEASITVRAKHTVVVSIPYTAATYSINYKDSVNMEYRPQSDGTFLINRSYNNWVKNLDQAIRANMVSRNRR
jgi:hypothetical protein